ncbi:SGNH/GDSL hydrolase family protein [Lichenibacterium dinghuense]|uniref:SGNH/GDSL hydrolase family protein n=1 Tax=Lichenibacterium dinghuense TaxID=2895977 RepID=UPI001F41A73F|nr:SGNH/GDSL hydrolase family protein [Lichenibacterium sp. 6Y81]
MAVEKSWSPRLRSVSVPFVTTLAVALAPIALLAPRPAAAQAVATWESGIANIPAPMASGRTVRQFARIAVGGTAIRLRFSNETGTRPLALGDVHVALPGPAPGSVDPSTDHLALFGGGRTTVVAPGGAVVSDEVPMPVQPLTRLAVSAFFSSASPVQVGHLIASETNYLAPGPQADQAVMPEAVPTSSGFYLSGISAEVDNLPGGAVACLGDSLTDGLDSSQNAERRWPDRLSERLLAATRGRVGAIDAGISGNGMLQIAPLGTGGPNAPARLPRDVLGRPGVHWLIVYEGINDIIYPPDAGDTAAELIAAYGQVIARAHEAGVRVFGATLTPFAGAGPDFYSPAREALRQRVNAWIRTSGAFDAVVRTPTAVPQVRAAYDGSDHIHLNDAGYAALADSIPLGAFLSGH